MTFLDTISTISSPVSVDGASPCDTPSGPMKDLYSQLLSPASHSAKQESNSKNKTTVTCSQSALTSLASYALQQSLESKLRAKLEGNGSPMFDMKWKHWDMLQGQPICALRALAHRTQGKGSTGLPTPSGCSNGGKNHVVGRLDEWGGSSNPFRGTEIGKVRCASFEAWMMGFPMEWVSPMVLETLSFRPLRKRS